MTRISSGPIRAHRRSGWLLAPPLTVDTPKLGSTRDWARASTGVNWKCRRPPGPLATRRAPRHLYVSSITSTKVSPHFAGPTIEVKPGATSPTAACLPAAGVCRLGRRGISRPMGYFPRNQVSRSVSSVQVDELVNLPGQVPSHQNPGEIPARSRDFGPSHPVPSSTERRNGANQLARSRRRRFV